MANQQGTTLLCEPIANSLAINIGTALTVMDSMARFGSYRDLGWKRRWPPLNSQISVNVTRVSHLWPRGFRQAQGCVMAGTARTEHTPRPTAPTRTKSPSRSAVKSWAQISRLPAERGRGAKAGEGLLEGTGKFNLRKEISISAFLETLPAISSIFC